jgi:hypothetical protein
MSTQVLSSSHIPPVTTNCESSGITLGIPVKVNAVSGGKPNGIPERR